MRNEIIDVFCCSDVKENLIRKDSCQNNHLFLICILLFVNTNIAGNIDNIFTNPLYMAEARTVHGIGIECEFLIYLDVTSIRERLNEYDNVARIPEGMKILAPLNKLDFTTINPCV